MQLLDFLTNIDQQNIESISVPLIRLTGKKYPYLFCSVLLEYIRLRTKQPVHSIPIEAHSVSRLREQSSMMFLGQSVRYWLGNLSTVPVQRLSEIHDYLAKYTGPHQIYFFSHDIPVREKMANSILIDLDIRIQLGQYRQLFSLLYPVYAKKQMPIMNRLFTPYASFSIDQACLLMQYQMVLGSGMNEFCASWLERLIGSESSLFALSEAFFSRNSLAFFAQWDSIRHRYPISFWTTYWSEQLFRAYSFVYYKRKKKQAQAKTISFRLPFKLVRLDWQYLSCTELHNAHQFIYQLDLDCKNGYSDSYLELFYHKFLLKRF